MIDRLSADLREAFADMKGFSPRNLKYMRAFAAAWPERTIVQQLAAQIPWFHNCLLPGEGGEVAFRIDYLLTWNCKHIANAATRGIIEETCREAGYEPPTICTPEELTED